MQNAAYDTTTVEKSVIDDLISENSDDEDRKDSDGSPQMRLFDWLISPLRDLRGQDAFDARGM